MPSAEELAAIEAAHRAGDPSRAQHRRTRLRRLGPTAACVGWLLSGALWRHGQTQLSAAAAAAACLATFSVLLGAALERRFVVVTVRGPSMEPTFRDRDRVLVRRTRELTPGQVVVVEQPTGDETRLDPPTGTKTPVADREWIIKRVIAIPGDPTPRTTVDALADVPEEQVPAGCIVLLGDNRAHSFDSRRVGYFPLERALGTVVRTLGRASANGSAGMAAPRENGVRAPFSAP